MILSYEDAYYYKLLMQAGFEKEVNEWINIIASTNETLEDIYLDLVCSLGNINDIISCLHNYINDHSINDEEVCNRLRLFIKDKLDKNELLIEEASNAIFSFVMSSGKWNEKYWSDLYSLNIYYEYYTSDFLSQEEYYVILKDFIETGKKHDFNEFWNKRDYKNSDAYKKERKYKLIWSLVLILYFIFILFVSSLIMKLEKSITGSISDKSIGIYVIAVCLLYVPPVVISVLNWNFVYLVLTKEYKRERRKLKEARKKIYKQNEDKSDSLRKKYNIPNSILTTYEYSNFTMKEYFSKLRWTLFVIFSILCLGAVLGSVLYFDKVSIELGIFIIMLGIVFGIYGFCILLKAYLKGLIYSFGPVLCYALPLVVTYYLLNITNELIIGLSTIIIGSILFIIFIVLLVVLPMKKYNKTYMKYWNDTNERYPELEDGYVYLDVKYNIGLYKKDGTHINIFEMNDKEVLIILKGKKKVNGVILNDAVIDYIKVNDSFDNSISTAIKILENHK